MAIYIKNLPLPDQIKDIIHSRGISELYPPQAEAIEKGLFGRKNFVIAIPTASGKTLLAELAFLKTIIEDSGKALYLVPLKALASEKLSDFKQWEEKKLLSVAQSTGDFDSVDPSLGNYDIIILTYEKLDSLLRHEAAWIKDVSLLIVDEIHLLNDPRRGPTLEIILLRLKKLNPSMRIIALSATIQNADKLAGWLNGELITSDWRPVPLREGILLQNSLKFDNTEILLPKKNEDPLLNLILSCLHANHQSLIFTNTRRSAEALAKNIRPLMFNYLNSTEKARLNRLKAQLSQTGDDSKFLQGLIYCASQGVSFHHAGLNRNQRQLIEEHYKEGNIKIICATPTLAIGVNLPARRVIVTSYQRFDSNFGLRLIPVLEYKQFVGRAGRPKYDELGESILIAKSEEEKEFLLERYIKGTPEEIISKLARKSILRTHLLSSIAMRFARTEKDLQDFMNETFFAFQHPGRNLTDLIGDILQFLLENKFISKDKGGFIPTLFGKRVSQLYLDPFSAIILKDGLFSIKNSKNCSDLGVLHLVCSVPDMEKRYLQKGDSENYELFSNRHKDEFLYELLLPETQSSFDHLDTEFISAKAMLERKTLKEIKRPVREVDEWFLSEVKTACLLLDWIYETEEDSLLKKYRIQPGDLYRYIETANWLLYSLEQFYSLFRMKIPLMKSHLSSLRIRIKYGIKPELLDLASIKGVGRKRARILFSNGYKSAEDIKRALPSNLARLPRFGPDLVKAIGDQLNFAVGVLKNSDDTKQKGQKAQQRLKDFL